MQLVVHMLYILMLQLGRVSRVALPKRYPMVVPNTCGTLSLNLTHRKLEQLVDLQFAAFCCYMAEGPKRSPMSRKKDDASSDHH